MEDHTIVITYTTKQVYHLQAESKTKAKEKSLEQFKIDQPSKRGIKSIEVYVDERAKDKI